MKKKILECDYLIVGAGIIGLATASILNEKEPTAKILIIEKESDIGFHGSGRNSGVLHAGFYYTADSLKAKFTRDGCLFWTKYCLENKLKINRSQKVVVAQNEEEIKGIYELEKRGKTNGVNVKIITAEELLKLDPNIKTHKIALYSPDTSTIDPLEICHHLKNKLLQNNVQFIFSNAYKKRTSENTIESEKYYINFKKFINAAGLYADKIAKDFGFGKQYTIIPFKGLYLKMDSNKESPIVLNVYPVPNLNNPFLGVHFTITVGNEIKIGPTAIPALWRENYNGFKNFNLFEFITIIGYQAKLFILNSFNFRNLALTEIKKYHRNYFINLARSLVKDLSPYKFSYWSKPGIRAQLLNTKTNELVQDFIVESDHTSIHILNAVSPAFTSSFPFARWIIENHIIISK